MGKTGSGYMIEFEGYEEDGAQETAVEDVEVFRLLVCSSLTYLTAVS